MTCVTHLWYSCRGPHGRPAHSWACPGPSQSGLCSSRTFSALGALAASVCCRSALQSCSLHLGSHHVWLAFAVFTFQVSPLLSLWGSLMLSVCLCLSFPSLRLSDFLLGVCVCMHVCVCETVSVSRGDALGGLCVCVCRGSCGHVFVCLCVSLPFSPCLLPPPLLLLHLPACLSCQEAKLGPDEGCG